MKFLIGILIITSFSVFAGTCEIKLFEKWGLKWEQKTSDQFEDFDNEYICKHKATKYANDLLKSHAKHSLVQTKAKYKFTPSGVVYGSR